MSDDHFKKGLIREALFEMCCFHISHMGIEEPGRGGGGGGGKGLPDGLEHFFFQVCPLDKGEGV